MPAPDSARRWIGLVLVGVVFSVLLRLTFLPTIWLPIGLVAIGAAWIYIANNFETGKWLHWAMGVVLFLSFLGGVWPMIWSRVDPYLNDTIVAGKQRALSEDNVRALQITPPMLTAEERLALASKSIEEAKSKEIANSLAAVEEDVRARRITPEEGWDRTLVLLKEKQEWDRKVRSFSLSAPESEKFRVQMIRLGSTPTKVTLPADARRWGMYPIDNRSTVVIELRNGSVRRFEKTGRDGTWTEVSAGAKLEKLPVQFWAYSKSGGPVDFKIITSSSPSP